MSQSVSLSPPINEYTAETPVLVLGLPGVPPPLAWNTAVSFVTNTNWQAYSGESTQGHLVQMAGLAVQNFASAAVGMAVAIALVRGFARRHAGELGNFWVDLTRGIIRILLPVSIVAAIILIAGGAIQNFHLHDQVVNTLAGGQQTITGGPVASQEAIKELGTNGGGFYNANSAHPFENPTTWTNWIEIFLLLVISFSLPRTFGRMVDSKKQGYAIAAVMATLAGISVAFMMLVQLQHHGTNPTAIGAAMARIGLATRIRTRQHCRSGHPATGRTMRRRLPTGLPRTQPKIAQCLWPTAAARGCKRPQLVIVNLQWTPKDRQVNISMIMIY